MAEKNLISIPRNGKVTMSYVAGCTPHHLQLRGDRPAQMRVRATTAHFVAPCKLMRGLAGVKRKEFVSGVQFKSTYRSLSKFGKLA